MYKAILAAALALPLLVGTILAGSLVGGLGQLLPTLWTLGLAALVIGASVLDERHRWWLYAIGGVLVTATLGWLLAPVLIDRKTGTAVCGGLAALAVTRAREMVLTYADYLLADVELPKGATVPQIDFGPCYWIGGAYLVILLVAPSASVASASVLTMALSVWVVLRYAQSIDDLTALGRLFRNVAWVWADAKDDVAEGRAWKPCRPRWQRRAILFVAVLSIALTSVIATSYWATWGTRKDQSDKPYSWLYLPLTDLVTQSDPAYRWSAVLAIVLTVTMPGVILATILLPALVQVRQWEQSIRRQADDDPRSELDKLLDKCRNAPSAPSDDSNWPSLPMSTSTTVPTPSAGQDTKGA
jgi:hypothetical protein